MKKIALWTLASVAFMAGIPWLTVTFVGSAGMAICFILFFAVDPLYAAICGAAAGKDIRKLWALPIIVAVSFLAGVWLFFEMGEPAFLLYGGCYLIIGIIAMLVSGFIHKVIGRS